MSFYRPVCKEKCRHQLLMPALSMRLYADFAHIEGDRVLGHMIEGFLQSFFGGAERYTNVALTARSISRTGGTTMPAVSSM